MLSQKEHIISVASTLFLDKGVRVSTAKIAAAAGISNGTLFNVFPTKQALIDTIYLNAKLSMFARVVNCDPAPFNKKTLRANWDGYLDWARENPEMRRVMHLLLDAGLASSEAQAEVAKIVEPHVMWLQNALDRGMIRGPSVSFIGQLIFFHFDLVINEKLDASSEDLAFEMLCNSIGLKS